MCPLCVRSVFYLITWLQYLPTWPLFIPLTIGPRRHPHLSIYPPTHPSTSVAHIPRYLHNTCYCLLVHTLASRPLLPTYRPIDSASNESHRIAQGKPLDWLPSSTTRHTISPDDRPPPPPLHYPERRYIRTLVVASFRCGINFASLCPQPRHARRTQWTSAASADRPDAELHFRAARPCTAGKPAQ